MKLTDYFIVLLLLVFAFGGNFSSSPDAVAIVYESETTTPAPYVLGAINQLSQDGYSVRMIDDDTTTGQNEQPGVIGLAVQAARKSGLPALVLISGGKVITAKDLPATKADILEAVR